MQQCPSESLCVAGLFAGRVASQREVTVRVLSEAGDAFEGTEPQLATLVTDADGRTVRRLRPIVLTAAAAVLAMIPLTRSVFWGPMVVAIMGGLVVATVLTLLALPAMYAAWYRVRKPVSDAG